MALYPFQYVNTRGIPTIQSTGVTVGTDAVTFSFRSTATAGTPFRGLLLVYLSDAIPEGTTATLPIRFTSASAGTENVTTYNGDPLTVADIPGTGVYLLYYDRVANILQLIN